MSDLRLHGRYVFNVPDPSNHGHWMSKNGGGGGSAGSGKSGGNPKTRTPLPMKGGARGGAGGGKQMPRPNMSHTRVVRDEKGQATSRVTRPLQRVTPTRPEDAQRGNSAHPELNRGENAAVRRAANQKAVDAHQAEVNAAAARGQNAQRAVVVRAVDRHLQAQDPLASAKAGIQKAVDAYRTSKSGNEALRAKIEQAKAIYAEVHQWHIGSGAGDHAAHEAGLREAGQIATARHEMHNYREGQAADKAAARQAKAEAMTSADHEKGLKSGVSTAARHQAALADYEKGIAAGVHTAGGALHQALQHQTERAQTTLQKRQDAYAAHLERGGMSRNQATKTAQNTVNTFAKARAAKDAKAAAKTSGTLSEPRYFTARYGHMPDPAPGVRRASYRFGNFPDPSQKGHWHSNKGGGASSTGNAGDRVRSAIGRLTGRGKAGGSGASAGHGSAVMVRPGGERGEEFGPRITRQELERHMGSDARYGRTGRGISAEERAAHEVGIKAALDEAPMHYAALKESATHHGVSPRAMEMQARTAIASIHAMPATYRDDRGVEHPQITERMRGFLSHVAGRGHEVEAYPPISLAGPRAVRWNVWARTPQEPGGRRITAEELTRDMEAGPSGGASGLLGPGTGLSEGVFSARYGSMIRYRFNVPDPSNKGHWTRGAGGGSIGSESSHVSEKADGSRMELTPEGRSGRYRLVHDDGNGQRTTINHVAVDQAAHYAAQHGHGGLGGYMTARAGLLAGTEPHSPHLLRVTQEAAQARAGEAGAVGRTGHALTQIVRSRTPGANEVAAAQHGAAIGRAIGRVGAAVVAPVPLVPRRQQIEAAGAIGERVGHVAGGLIGRIRRGASGQGLAEEAQVWP